MQRRIFVIAIFLLALGAGVFFLLNGRTQDAGSTLRVNNRTLQVEVRDTESERNEGLSGRAYLHPDTGMLFLFPTADIHTFWMKDMRFPLDFVWLRDGVVRDITLAVPQPSPGTPDNELPTYAPIEPVDAVLEVNAGVVNELGITIGMPVTLSGL